MASSSPRVVVVGAGVAGLTAAACLINNGLEDVVVLEAQDYVGGRVKAKVIGPNKEKIDLGAQFVHGREGNPAYEIAEKLGIVIYPEGSGDAEKEKQLLYWTGDFLTSKGEKVPIKKVKLLLEHMQKELESHTYDDDTKTVGKYVEEAYGTFLTKHKLLSEEKDLYDAVYRWCCTKKMTDFAVCDLHDLSSWGDNQYVELAGERFTEVRGGMTAILDAIADLIPQDVIRLNTPVKNIDWSGGKVLVTCTDGEVIECDHVVVTISLGCMHAQHKDMFTPNLPLPSQTALEHVGFGAIGKIFVKWEEPFWQSLPKERDIDFQAYEFLWLNSHSIDVPSDKCQKKTRFGKPWWYGLQSVESPEEHPNILEWWLTLDQVEVVEQLSDEEILVVCREVLQAFLKDVKVPAPVEVHRTYWLSNPYTRGTYSYPSASMRKTDVDYLGVPLPSHNNPKVLFAGESYTMKFMSAFHGALTSGQQQAHLLLKTHGIQTSKRLVDLIPTKK